MQGQGVLLKRRTSANALEVGSNDARVLPDSVVHLQIMNQNLYLEP